MTQTKFPPKKTRDEYVKELWVDPNISIPAEQKNKDAGGLEVTVTYYTSNRLLSTFSSESEEGYNYPNAQNIDELATVYGWKKIKEIARKEVFHYHTGIPGTLHDLMDELILLVPELANKHDEVKAKIKGFVHEEKYSTYTKFKHYFKDLIEGNKFFGDFIRDKLATHGPEGWLNYDMCLDWVKQYGKLRNKNETLDDSVRS